MHPDPRYVKEETLLKEMIQIMIEEDVTELPVVDTGKRVIGEVNVIEAIAGYLKAKGFEQSE